MSATAFPSASSSSSNSSVAAFVDGVSVAIRFNEQSRSQSVLALGLVDPLRMSSVIIQTVSVFQPCFPSLHRRLYPALCLVGIGSMQSALFVAVSGYLVRVQF